jgi:hypothetical protein
MLARADEAIAPRSHQAPRRRGGMADCEQTFL